MVRAFACLRFVAIILLIAASAAILFAARLLSLLLSEHLRVPFVSYFSVLSNRIIGFVAGLRVEVRTVDFEQHLAPRLIVSNHISYLDIVVLGSIFPARFVAKSEVAKWPVIGTAGRAFGSLFVERESLASRVQLLRSMRRALRTENVCVFPEGTTTANTKPELSAWQAGNLWPARNSNIAVAGLAYEDQTDVAWVEDQSFAPHLFRFLMRPTTHVVVTLTTRHVPSHAKEIRQTAQDVHRDVVGLCEMSHARLNFSKLYFSKPVLRRIPWRS